MHVLNISFQIASSQQYPWIIWMKDKFIPMLQASQCFNSHQFYELEVEADQAPTYTLQLFFPDKEMRLKFQQNYAPQLLEELANTWGNQCFHFITTMKIVN